MDLARQQVKDGHQVSMLWAGHYTILGNRTGIKQHRAQEGILSFEVINPNPVPYDEGILDTKAFMHKGSKEVYSDFLKNNAPEVIHIHTLMGLHETLLIAAKELHIRVVFSAHDFFPVCPKVTLFRDGDVCKSAGTCEECADCNKSALSLTRIKLLQSGIYRLLKDSPPVKLLRKRHRDNYLGDKAKVTKKQQKFSRGAAANEGERPAWDGAEQYRVLRKYFAGLLSYADVIHFNSCLTRGVYDRYVEFAASKIEVLPITHGQIRDNRERRSYSDVLRITYMGAQSSAKGYYILKAALDEIFRERKIVLNVFFKPAKSEEYIQVHERFSHGDLKAIFSETDILAAPSLLYDTFGYTVLEALSFGVPVLISANVGAKDIVPQGCGIIIEDITAEKIAEAIRSLDAGKLKEMNENILSSFNPYTIEDMRGDIEKKFYGI